MLDKNSSGYITAKDLRALVIGMHLDETDMDIDDAVAGVMLDFDKSHDSKIDMEEFVRGTTKWLQKAKLSAKKNNQSPRTPKLLNDFHLVCFSAKWSYFYYITLMPPLTIAHGVNLN